MNYPKLKYYSCTLSDGARNDTGRAFIRSVDSQRPNLTVMDRTIVHKLLIEDKKCVGVRLGDSNRFKKSKNSRDIHVDGEVILCGGAFETPAILQMSGIGDKEVKSTSSYSTTLLKNFSDVGQGRHRDDS